VLPLRKGFAFVAGNDGGTSAVSHAFYPHKPKRRMRIMGRYLLLWLLGVPIPILVLIYAFGGLNH
jgi:hypothetical protein